MAIARRSLILALFAPATFAACAHHLPRQQGVSPMYGLIGKMKAVAGKRDDLSAILLRGLADMPGNLSYIVANDPLEEDALWITEVWTDSKAHEASLALPSVQAAIKEGRPLIAGMERIAATIPIGGQGLWVD
jgi:quinol monooxygenase YgiN